MGDASRNPRSIQFKGPLPENDIHPHIVHQVTPSEEWLAANPDVDPQKCPIGEMEIVIWVALTWLFPSALARNRPEKWPGATVPMAILCRDKVTTLHRRVAVDMASRGETAEPLAGAEEPGGPPPAEPDPSAS